MRDFLRLLRKELRELLRPRYLLPILMIPILFVLLAQGIGSVQDDISDQPKIGVVNEDGGKYGELVAESLNASAKVVYSATSGTPKKAVQQVKNAGGNTVFVIPEQFSERIRRGRQGRIRLYSAIESVGLAGFASSVETDALLANAGRRITLTATNATPAMLNPVVPSHTTYLKGQTIDASPGAISGSFMQSIVPIAVVIAIVIMFSGQMVMNAMAVEKENKTLETLLTMPVKRRTIVAAKLVGGAAIGLIATAVYTVSFYYYISSFSDGGSLGGASVGLGFGGVEYGLIGASIFFTLIGTLALTLCLGIFTSDRQGAQMLLLPLVALVLLPMLATMFVEISTLSLPLQIVLYAIPFTHPLIAPKRLLFGDVGIVLAGIAYEIVFAGAMIGLAIWLFNSDRLVTGSTGRLGKVLSFMQR